MNLYIHHLATTTTGKSKDGTVQLGLFVHLIHSASPARRKPLLGANTSGGGLTANSSGHVKTLLASSSANNLLNLVTSDTSSSFHPTITPAATASQWFSNLFHSSTSTHPQGSGKPKSEPHGAAAALAGLVLPSGNIAHPMHRRVSSQGTSFALPPPLSFVFHYSFPPLSLFFLSTALFHSHSSLLCNSMT